MHPTLPVPTRIKSVVAANLTGKAARRLAILDFDAKTQFMMHRLYEKGGPARFRTRCG